MDCTATRDKAHDVLHAFDEALTAAQFYRSVKARKTQRGKQKALELYGGRFAGWILKLEDDTRELTHQIHLAGTELCAGVFGVVTIGGCSGSSAFHLVYDFARDVVTAVQIAVFMHRNPDLPHGVEVEVPELREDQIDDMGVLIAAFLKAAEELQIGCKETHQIRCLLEQELARLAMRPTVAGTDEKPPTDTAQLVLDAIINAGRPINGKEICNKTGGTESTLRRHIIPALKKSHGLRNRPGAGYYLPPM